MAQVSPVSAGQARRSGVAGRVVGQRWYTPYLFMLPGLALFALMFAWPAFVAFQLAFSRYNIVSPIEWVGLDNFAALAVDPRFHTAVVNSFAFMAMLVPQTVVLPLLLAMLVNQKLRGIQLFRVLYYLPVVTSMVAVAVAWRYLLTREGLFSWVLTLFGQEPQSFLLSSTLALPSLSVMEAWKSMGLYMMIYLAGLQGIPTEHLEAATVDGANAWQRLIHIVVPGMLPYFAVTLTLSMLEAMRSFESIYVMTRGGPQDATLTLGYYVWSQAFEKYDMGYASAVGLVLWAIMIVLALVNQYVTKERG